MQGAYGAAIALAGAAQLASIGVAFWLGARLLRRASSGAGAPEVLLGLHLLLALGVGSLLLSIASSAAYRTEPMSPTLFQALVIVGNVATLLGLMAALWFNYHVFHEGRPVGRAIALFVTALMWLGFAWYVHAGGIRGPVLYGSESWPYVAAMVIGDLWLVHDAIRFRRQLVRRLALGLIDPLVVDRMLLWALASMARVALVLIAPIASAVTGASMMRLDLVVPILALSGLLILAATVSLWLMLAPSELYRRWVARRYAHG